MPSFPELMSEKLHHNEDMGKLSVRVYVTALFYDIIWLAEPTGA